MSLVLDEHRQYLGDAPRIAAFRAALRAAVRPGDVVLDLACGTGILGFLACEAGAARVYAIDTGPIIDIARRLARANGFADRITFIRELSTRAELPERVDLVVCDQIGQLGIEAGAAEYLDDARRRFLKPGGRSIPEALTFMAAPVESDVVRERIAFWDSRPAGLDTSAAREIAQNTGYPLFVDAEELLADPAPFARAALPPVGLGPIHGRAEYIVARPGRLDGVAAWFDAELAAGVRMTNAPMAPERIRRRQVVLPTAGAVAVEAGDRVTLAMAMLPPDMVNWQVSVRRGDAALDGASFSHSTFRGMLLSAEDLSRTRLDSRPVLTPAGVARRTVLELCDGSRPLREVQDGVFERHRQLFATHHDAATFVAEVVTRYCVADAPLPDREPPRR